MRVLLTRPKESNEPLAELLRQRGHEVLLSPAMDIRLAGGPDLRLDGVQAILATSATGVRALARRTPRRDIPLFAVGRQTAEEARAAEFSEVRHSESDAAGLAAAVKLWTTPETGAVLHVAGRHHSPILQQTLSKHGFAVRTEELYEAVETHELNAKARATIAAGALDAVMLFSPRSAQIFARQVCRASLARHCARLIALCISAATGNALAPLGFATCRIAARSDQQGMIGLLDALGPGTTARRD